MMAGVSSVALVVRLKSMERPCASACSLAYCHDAFQQRKIHQRLAAEERDVHGAPLAGLLKQKVDRGARRLEVHELRLALGRRDLVLAELVAILAGEIALIGQIQHQRLQREVGRRILRRLGRCIACDDGAALRQLTEQADCILAFKPSSPRRSTSSSSARSLACEKVQYRGGGTVQFEDRAGRNQVGKRLSPASNA